MISEQTSDMLLIFAGVLFLACAGIGFHLWQRGRLVIFTGWPDMIITCGSPVVIPFLLGFIRTFHLSNHGNEDISVAEIVLWCLWGVALLIGAWRANDKGWKFWFALPTRLLAIALVFLAIVMARELLAKFLKKRG